MAVMCFVMEAENSAEVLERSWDKSVNKTETIVEDAY